MQQFLPYQPTLIASANVRPARILVGSNTVVNQAAEATGSTARIVGISVNSRRVDGVYERLAENLAARTGEAIPYVGAHRVTEVLSGAAVNANFNRPITSDGAGRGVLLAAPTFPLTAAAHAVGYAVDSCAAADQLIRVYTCLVGIPLAI